MFNPPPATDSLASSDSPSSYGHIVPPIRRHTLSDDIAARFSDTIGWSPKGFHPDLLASPTSEEPPEPPKPSELTQPVLQECRHNDSNAELWKATLERAVKGIVSIKYTTLRSFDQVTAGIYAATGFVVDRTNGFILSNRHIVTPGPTSTTALFNKCEELPLVPIYFDPVHDFGFLKYDPAKIKYAEIEEIELCPEAAKVGMEIKICGNDAGEHGSIWGSTLARLDRPAPYHSDFNTFYIQAVSGTSAGSSGSPVLDIFGRAVALNVGGSTISASSFYLPLDRVVRALKLLQKGEPVPRGTLQTEFIHVSYDELKKLGLPDEIETETRQRNESSTGLLTVAGVLPEGPASTALQVGDIVVKCHHPAFGDRYIENFVSFWEIIDESISDLITLTVLRGKQEKVVEVKVQDLNLIIPDTFLEVGQAIIHPISYQIARLFHLPCRGLFVAESGIFDIPPHFLITQLDNRNVNTLDDVIEIFQSIPDGKRVTLTYRRVGGWNDTFHIFIVDSHFFPMALFKRQEGRWDRKVLKPHPMMDPELKALDIGTEATWKARLRARLLNVYCWTPYQLQGVSSRTILGGGILVTVEPIPLIVISRTLVPISICDIWITIGNRSLPGRVVYLGIVTVVTINGTLLRSADVLPISTNEYKVGDRIDLFSIDSAMQLVQLPTELREIAPIMSGPFRPPRWRIKNVEALYILGAPVSNDGFLIDPEEKSVVALWMTIDGIRIGLDYNRYIRPIIETLQNAKENDRCSGWIFGWMSLPNAIHLGLNDQRAAQMATLVNRIRSVHRAICVSGKLRSVTPDNLKIGDIILEVNNLPVVRMADIHNLSQIESAQILVLRDRQEILVNLDTQRLPSELMSRIMFWAGAYLHETHDSVLEQIAPEFEEIANREGMADIRQSVYISSIKPGSPASIGLLQSNWILEVHGHKVRTMDDMLHVNSTLHNEREYLRVKMIASNGVMSVRSVRLDSKFWPAWILDWKDNQWVRTELE